jgi:hypothetical protein
MEGDAGPTTSMITTMGAQDQAFTAHENIVGIALSGVGPEARGGRVDGWKGGSQRRWKSRTRPVYPSCTFVLGTLNSVQSKWKGTD